MEREEIKGFLEYLHSVSPWITTLLLSTWAALVQYIEKVRKGAKWRWRDLMYDVIICGFVGYITQLLCEWAGISGPMMGILIAVSAHMGTRALVTYEAFRNRVLGAETKGV